MKQEVEPSIFLKEIDQHTGDTLGHIAARRNDARLFKVNGKYY